MQYTIAQKVTYSADITVPKEFVVKMSALDTGSETKDDKKVYSFSQDTKIPSYLLAMVVGDLEYADVGDRVGVITEPNDLDKAKYDLKEAPKFLTELENYLTPYAWKQFNVVLLPGVMTQEVSGMENPYLTIV